MFRFLLRLSVVSCCALIGFASAATARKKADTEKQTKDSIEVTGHLALPEGPFRLVSIREHLRRRYAYLEETQSGTLAIVDTTDYSDPKLIRTLKLPKNLAVNHLGDAVGDALLLTTSEPQPAAAPVDSITILDFSDPANPKVTRTFDHVTSILRDPARLLIYVTAADGLWVLQERSRPDLELQRQYDRELLYNH